jgi:hypothetical protein
MALAQQQTHNADIAVKRLGVPIPEVGLALNRLDDNLDVHFGINTDDFDVELDMTIPAEADLEGLGPRILDIKHRGGRTAEDTWRVLMGGRVYGGGPRVRGATPGFQVFFDNFNQNKPIKPGKELFPVGAKHTRVAVGGQAKGYDVGATHKHQADGEQYGVRWSKTALEHAASHGGGKRIHFHLDGMGDISGIAGKSGDFAFNVTGRELRYVWRNWNRFQWKVIFYNGYTGFGHAVIVEPPWLADWQADDSTTVCMQCGKEFGTFRWRHHCRGCGRVLCDGCCSQKKRIAWPVAMPGKPRETDTVRLCAACYLRL